MRFSPAYIISRFLYSSVIFLAMPLLNLHLRRRIILGKEDPDRIDERKGVASVARPPGSIIWFHAASVGESLSAIPVIECLLKRTDNVTVLLTTGTVTSARLMHERLPQGAIHQFVPLDHASWIQKFLDHWQPSAVIWLESEFWPNTLYTVKKNSIPLILLNGRVSQRSHNQWKKAPWIIRNMLSCFDICLAQASEDARHLTDLGARNVINRGNIKLGAPALPVDEKQLGILSKKIKGRQRWLLSSTHDGEEAMAASIHRTLREKFPDILTFIAPRHPERGPIIAEQMRNKGLNVGLRSAGDQPQKNMDIYIADTIGELGLFYRLCDIVFMGKSLIKPGGGQNPFEAARLNCVVLFGPNMSNFKELSATMIQAGAAFQVEDSRGLERKVSQILSSPQNMATYKSAVRNYCQVSDSVIEDSVTEILNFLPDNDLIKKDCP